jgi:hypothetical protein
MNTNANANATNTNANACQPPVERIFGMAGPNHQFGWGGNLRTMYPPQPVYSPTCTINVDYDTLPQGYPMRKTTLGANSLKKLYEGPLYYPPQTMAVPRDTLYGLSTATERPHGIRLSYGAMLYPYRHRSPKEVREYTQDIAPSPRLQDWTSHAVAYDGYWSR